ncbi:MAG: tetratricopeptide repeat protein [Candidatus Aminicenantes bacterium]|nr:tetratricopeptide repeat protein [Candidatus Aminicenantes bacterium]
MKKIVFIGLMVVFLFISLLPQATSGKGKMSGAVTDAETGEPIEGVTIKLFCLRAKAFHRISSKTDKDGYWRAMYLRGGLWHLDFEKAGYETKKLSFKVETIPGAKKPRIDIKLRKIEGPSLAETTLKDIDAANRLVAERQYDEALKKFKEILAKNKELEGIAIVNLYMGNCYAMKEDYLKAIEYYEHAVEKYPKNKELLISIGNAYNNLNKFDDAMSWFQKVSSEDIHNVDTLYNIGVIYYNKAKYDDAIKYFEKSTEVFNEFADGFYQLGMTYTALNKIPEALVALKKFMELDPESPNYQTAKAIVDAFSNQ